MQQIQALDILKTGANVFLTGEPGAGKTYVINQYIAWLLAAKIPVAVTASTGIAATHIGGMTIHSWSGIGIKDSLSNYDLEQIAGKEKVSKRISKAKVLIIDEISMLDGKVVDMVDQVCRHVKNKPEPFGGLQVVFVGDFFQLPPVTKQGGAMRYGFESHAWQSAKILTCYIGEQYRQEDELFLSLLKSIRKGEIEEEHYTLLSEQKSIDYEDIEPTQLYTHNTDVDAVNQTELKKLSGAPHTFKMNGKGNKQVVEGLVRNCLSPEVLELKEEAMVMCTKNNFEAGYVNGTLGRVVSFDAREGWPIIKTSDGREITVKPTSWEVVEDGKIRASIEQIPLRLAWAITVHKSQGMSLDAAVIDLSKAFVYGQGYVALSRVRSLSGLKVAGMHPNALQVDPKILSQDERFHSESESAEEAFDAMEETNLLGLQEQFVKSMGGTMPKGEIKVAPVHERLEKESTTEVTLRLVLEGKTVSQIAKERSLKAQTVWGHIESLLEQDKLSQQDVKSLLPANWTELKKAVYQAIDKVGDEFLKPIYEELGEKYEYDDIRLARLWRKLESK